MEVRVKNQLIETVKGLICFEVDATLRVLYDDDKFYEITLKWSVSMEGLASFPLHELIHKEVSSIRFKDVAPYCKSYDMDFL